MLKRRTLSDGETSALRTLERAWSNGGGWLPVSNTTTGDKVAANSVESLAHIGAAVIRRLDEFGRRDPAAPARAHLTHHGLDLLSGRPAPDPDTRLPLELGHRTIAALDAALVELRRQGFASFDAYRAHQDKARAALKVDLDDADPFAWPDEDEPTAADIAEAEEVLALTAAELADLRADAQAEAEAAAEDARHTGAMVN